MPHAPFLFDRKSIKKFNNRNRPKDGMTYFNDYIDQSYFALEIVKNFSEELKKIGKFDDALIIVHADHGYGFINVEDNIEKIGSDAFSDIKIGSDDFSNVESQSHALLLVKYPNSKIEKYDNKLYYQNEFVSKLILDNFEIPNNIILNDQIIFFKNDNDLIIKNNLTGSWDE